MHIKSKGTIVLLVSMYTHVALQIGLAVSQELPAAFFACNHRARTGLNSTGHLLNEEVIY